MLGKGKTCLLVLGVKIGATTMEISAKLDPGEKGEVERTETVVRMY